MRRLIVIYCFLFGVLTSSFAQSKADADSAYQKGKYETAARIYEQLLSHGENAYLYYNLGNAYYRMHDIAHAILNYERAALREPGNSDIRFNLALARSKTEDKVADSDQFFIFYWFHSLVNAHNTDGWARMALIVFVMMLVAILLFFFGRVSLLRRISSYAVVLLFICVVLFNVFALIQRNEFLNKTRAIVMQTVPVKSTPDNSGNTLFTLHPGTKVKISDNSMTNWKEVSLSDGKKGWLSKSAIELI